MKKRVIALILTVALVLSGCAGVDLAGYFGRLSYVLTMENRPAFYEIDYTRPEVENICVVAEAVLEAAEGRDFNTLVNAVSQYMTLQRSFYTNLSLAYIHYCTDMRQTYWETEYNYCMDNSGTVDACTDEILHALAASRFREQLESEAYFGPGYFDDYQGESMWTEEFLDLMDRESQLISRYYEITESAREADGYSEAFFEEYGTQLGALYGELVLCRQEIAREAGYEDYVAFAYDYYYHRDYTPEQVDDYVRDIRQELVPVYRDLYFSGDIWEAGYEDCGETETFEYVKECADAMGGVVAEAFDHMSKHFLYNLTYSEYKYQSSYELYLYDYYQPYIFLCPSGTVRDKLTFAHEFGHFSSDYACMAGSNVSVDVAEVFSQGMEYMSLLYCADTQELELMKMGDSLCVFVEQAAYAAFENQVYRLAPEEVTAEKLYELYAQVSRDFGFDTWGRDPRDFVMINHFFTNPLYVISYVVSNDTAMQLYQMELEEAGAGAGKLMECLNTEEMAFLGFLESEELDSPFACGRVASLRETFEEVLG